MSIGDAATIIEVLINKETTWILNYDRYGASARCNTGEYWLSDVGQ